MITFICSTCGAIAHTAVDDLEDGTMLNCDKCRQDTIVTLSISMDYRILCEVPGLLRKLVAVRAVNNMSICCSVSWNIERGIEHELDCPWRLAVELLEAKA